MTKKDIVKAISDASGLPQGQTKVIVDRIFEAIVDTLVQEGRIELRNFGVFEVKRRRSRLARNPRTGEDVPVPEKFVVKFKPGKEMEQRVAQLERRKTPAETNIQSYAGSPSSGSQAASDHSSEAASQKDMSETSAPQDVSQATPSEHS